MYVFDVDRLVFATTPGFSATAREHECPLASHFNPSKPRIAFVRIFAINVPFLRKHRNYCLAIFTIPLIHAGIVIAL